MTRILNTTVDQNLAAGYDVGGTKVDVRVRDKATGGTVFEQRYESCDFPSLDALLDKSLLDLGARPARIVMAVAGPRRSNGDVQMTNQRDWPLFEIAKTAKRLEIVIETVNDMVGTAARQAALVIGEQQLIKTGTADSAGPKLVIGVATGVGDALLLPDGTPVAAEGGHATWQPMTSLEYQYLQFLRAKYGTDTITVEVAASGLQGFENLYDFLTGEMYYVVSLVVCEQVEECRQLGEGIGRVITKYAVNKYDPFCRHLMEVLGSILGQHTRNRAVGTLPTGGVFFVGSVMQADGVADYLVNHTAFLERFIAKGAQHSDMMEAIPLYVVTDREAAVKGALELATRQY